MLPVENSCVYEYQVLGCVPVDLNPCLVHDILSCLGYSHDFNSALVCVGVSGEFFRFKILRFFCVPLIQSSPSGFRGTVMFQCNIGSSCCRRCLTQRQEHAHIRHQKWQIAELDQELDRSRGYRPTHQVVVDQCSGHS